MKIAIVDDDIYTCRMLKEVLRQHYPQYIVNIFADAEKALNDIIKAKDYDVVCVDQIMPKFDGTALIYKINDIYTPYFVLISSFVDNSFVGTIDDTELFDYGVSKPIVIDEFLSTIEDINNDIIIKYENNADQILTNVEVIKQPQKTFIKEILHNLLNDTEDTGMYQKLSENMYVQPESIRKRLSNIINRIYKKDTFQKYLDIDKIPTNTEFINKLKEQIEKESKKHNVL